MHGMILQQFPGIYRSSIQFHTWFSVALIIYSTTQIISRDMTALYLNHGLGGNVGNPETIMPELILWSIFVVSTVFQLSLAPTTFLNYCFVTSVEEYVKVDVVKKSFILDELMAANVSEECLVANMGEMKVEMKS